MSKSAWTAARKRRGRLLVIEGPDDVGKTTLAKSLVARLADEGTRTEYVAFPGSERGSIGELVYRIHHSGPELGIEAVAPGALQILHVAAHADVIEQRIEPSLKRGRTVVLDRYWWSAWVYGAASGVRRPVLRALIELERRCWGDIRPEVIILLDRDRPRNPRRSSSGWRLIRSEYRRLARAQAKRERVWAIANEASASKAAGTLTQLLADSPRKSSGSVLSIGEAGVTQGRRL